MKKLLFFLFLSSILSATAQDYQCLKNNSYYLYYDTEHNAFGVDSGKLIGVDSVFYITKQLRYDMDYLGANFIGHEVIRKPNGDYVFRNTEDEPVTIKSKAALHESWTCYLCPDGCYVNAVTTAHDTLTFLSVRDSVKKIEFITCNENGDTVTGNTDGFHLLLSQHHGLVEIVKFYLFPDKTSKRDLSNYGDEVFGQLSITGKSNPQIGMKNLTYREVYNYDVGDEFHYHYYDIRYVRREERQTIHLILDKIVTDSSYVYEMESCSYHVTEFPEQFNSYSTKEIINVTIDLKPNKYDALFLQSCVDEQGDGYAASPASLNGRDGKRFLMTMGFHTVYFFEGVGGNYFEFSDPWMPYVYRGNELVYYKKGDEVYGTPYDCETLSVETYSTKDEIKLFPNPAVSTLTIRDENGVVKEVQIFDLAGKMMKRMVNIHSAETTISVDELAPGIYLAKIVSEKGVMVKKFMKG